MNVRYHVKLGRGERAELGLLLQGGAQAVRKLKRAQILLAATACSSPPAGRARWTLELLAGEIVKLTSHESLKSVWMRWHNGNVSD